jgi:hypothetical protein
VKIRNIAAILILSAWYAPGQERVWLEGYSIADLQKANPGKKIKTKQGRPYIELAPGEKFHLPSGVTISGEGEPKPAGRPTVPAKPASKKKAAAKRTKTSRAPAGASSAEVAKLREEVRDLSSRLDGLNARLITVESWRVERAPSPEEVKAKKALRWPPALSPSTWSIRTWILVSILLVILVALGIASRRYHWRLRRRGTRPVP